MGGDLYRVVTSSCLTSPSHSPVALEEKTQNLHCRPTPVKCILVEGLFSCFHLCSLVFSCFSLFFSSIFSLILSFFLFSLLFFLVCRYLPTQNSMFPRCFRRFVKYRCFFNF